MSALPKILPLFLLREMIVLPRMTLPLPLFNEVEAFEIQALARGHRLIGIVQPQEPGERDTNEQSPLFKTGCACRIMSVNTLDDGQSILTIQGLCRFDILEELSPQGSLRKVVVSYDRYQGDLVHSNDREISIDRTRLLRAIRPYLSDLDIVTNWEEIEKTTNTKLINVLAMVCPFNPEEKQALLESPSLKEQSQLMTMLLEIEVQMNNDTLSTFRYH